MIIKELTKPEEISKIENLCITKRSINSQKNKNIEEKFSKNYNNTNA